MCESHHRPPPSFLTSVADWLQGSYIYPLYKAYGYDLHQIAILFVVGFLSSAIFGTVIGSVADKLGRKRVCILFCIIYSASCLTKLSHQLPMLLFGRLLGGISTSLLFSVFEAWMVSEHFSRVVANILVEHFGFVSPFMASIMFLTAACRT
ncbi:hypothetical protein BDK51DRAFT_17045 [Blyttiomyces helicus]|uniref:Molybdate-anion transporter n=1 Tax=Blyttiomyces helicus TaxID=388810 RepID=A0A4P9WA07_9FUNG|nr:hypothetical protein BDK51DRAFT_17045 [Blyttiomyces helicus]|eukprot:RKO87670.1 hypothetical protein BDK51DRAFT_17045 [Blyttiomyces helicus]